jgi:predicted dehydrogenase
MLQLIDSEVTEVSGYATTGFWGAGTPWKDDANEDEACAVVRFESGARATLTVSQLESNPKPGFLEITGTRGSYLMEDWEHYRLIRHRDGERIEEAAARHGDPQFERYFENVVAHLTRGEPLVITPEWARRPVHILDLAGRSAREQRALPAVHP